MNAAMIPAYLDRRMAELGHCHGYSMRVRHYVVPAGESVKISAYNEIYILLDQQSDVRIESDLGLYNVSGTGAPNQQQHEHTGRIILTNLVQDSECHVQFVQAIPLAAPDPDCKTCQQP